MLLLSVIVFEWPLSIRFLFSRAALQQAADAFIDGSIAGTGPQTIGLYHVEDIHYGWNDVVFVTGWNFDEAGFAYSPDDSRPDSRQRLAPCWYVYAAD